MVGVLLTVVEVEWPDLWCCPNICLEKTKGTCISVPGYLSGPSTAELGNGLDSPGFESQYMFSWSGQGQIYFITFTICCWNES